MRVKVRPEDAIWGAYTDPPEGIHTKEGRNSASSRSRPGATSLACARQTYLMDRHWISFEVRDGLEQAVAMFHENRFVLDDLLSRS